MVIFHSYVSLPEGNGIEHGHLIWFHGVFIVVLPFKTRMKFWNHDLAIELKVANRWLFKTQLADVHNSSPTIYQFLGYSDNTPYQIMWHNERIPTPPIVVHFVG